MSGYYGLRRPPVNVVGSGKSSYDEDIANDRKSCPRCGIVLIFREDINSLFCKKCAYRPPLPQPIKTPDNLTIEEEQQQQPQDNNEEEPITTVDGLQSKIGQRGTTLEEGFDNAIRIRPIANSGRRSDQLQKDAGRRGIHGLDHDLEMMLDKPGMNLVYSSEDIAEDGTTMSSADLSRRKKRF